MKNILNLVNALNSFGELESVETNTIHIDLKNDKGDFVARYNIKKRPVADKDGVQVWKYVARQAEVCRYGSM